MRREFRERKNRNKKSSNTSVFITGGVLILAIATFVVTFIVYSNKLNNDLYSYDSEYLAQYTNTNKDNNSIDISNQDTESASSSIGKNVVESEQKLKEETINTNKINGNPEKDNSFIIFAPNAVITVPILLSLNTAINWDAKNSKATKLPVFFI